MAELALETKQLGFQLEQVQDFTPTPMTIATEMFYAEMKPDGTPLYVAKTPEQKKSQKQFFFWYIPENRPQIRATLERLKLGKIGRLLLSRTAIAEGKNFSPSREREENPEFRERDLQKRAERSAVSIVPQKSGEKGRWENSARRERRQAEFGDKTWTPRHERRNEGRDEQRDVQRQEGRRGFHRDDRRGNSRDDQRKPRNNSPVQFGSHRRGR